MGKKSPYICGLDIGSAFVRAVAAQRHEDGKSYVVGAAEARSEGVSKGAIVSLDDVVSSMSTALEQLERMIGGPVDRCVVSVSGCQILTQIGKGIIAVGRADGEINEEDVDRVLESAQAVATPPNYEILHVIPRHFNVDDQVGIKDPVGMNGIRLEVEAHIIHALVSQTKNISKAVYRVGLEVEDMVLGILAAAEVVLSKRQKEMGVAVVNIGATTTSYAVFEENDVLSVGVLPVGSSHVTSDIAIGLRTSLDIAEQIKLEYGHAVAQEVEKHAYLDLSEFSDDESDRIPVRHVSEIIEARLEEIFQMVDNELAKIERSGILPAGIVFIGGGAKLPGIVDLAKKQFRLPASLGVLQSVYTAIDKIKDISFVQAAGLADWGVQVEEGSGKEGWLTKLPQIEKIGEYLRKVLPRRG